MFVHKTSYPFVLVPGAFGYGEESTLGKVFPYFGTTASSVTKIANSMGLECHTPTFGMLSGAWDRACEMYAQIVGGTVDYGESHSKKYGHPRFGKTYQKAMIPNWGMLDEAGKIVKINLLAHGFGAPAARYFAELMTYGSADEQAVTPKGALSGLFMGGYGNLINSITTIGGLNEGTTFFQALEYRIPGSIRMLTKVAIVIEEGSARLKFVDPYYTKQGLRLTQFGVGMKVAEKFDKKNPKDYILFDEPSIDAYLKRSDENIFYEMGISGMNAINNKLHTLPNVYYLCIAGDVTKKVKKFTIPTLAAGILAPSAALIGTFENYLPDAPTVTGALHPNDGLVNTSASLPPRMETVKAFSSPENSVPGVWYQMPVEKNNHMAFRGFFERPDEYRNYIYDLIKIITNFEEV